MQGFAFNTRRTKFGDSRVRRAFNFAFDFEKINREFFFGEHTRISSYFDGTELASSGLPQGRELELLLAVRSEVPPAVFTTPYWNPVNGSDEAEREPMDLANMRENGVRSLAVFMLDFATAGRCSMSTISGGDNETKARNIPRLLPGAPIPPPSKIVIERHR
jgi:ABC-type oligopeptide transport system substrate-binding subunit